MAGRKKEQEAPERILYRARSSGVVRIDGFLHRYTAGRTILPGDHPLVLRLPSRFLPYRLPGDRPPVAEIVPPPIVAEVPVTTEPEIIVEEGGLTDDLPTHRLGVSRTRYDDAR